MILVCMYVCVCVREYIYIYIYIYIYACKKGIRFKDWEIRGTTDISCGYQDVGKAWRDMYIEKILNIQIVKMWETYGVYKNQ